MSYNPVEPGGYPSRPFSPPPAVNFAPPAPARLPSPALANACFFTAMLAFLFVSVVAALFRLDFTITSPLSEGVLVLVSLIFCLSEGFNFKEIFSLRKISLGTVILCVFLGLAGQFAVRFPSLLNEWLLRIFGPFPNPIPDAGEGGGRILFFLIIVVVAPLCEETLLRGFVLSGYRGLGFGRSIFFVGLFFGFAHFYPSRFAYTFLLGMALAYLVLVTGSIFSSILAHAGFNLLGGLSPWLTDWLNQFARDNGQKVPDTSDLITFSTVLSTIPISLVGGLIFFFLLRSISRRAMQRRPELEPGFLGLVRGFRPLPPRPEQPPYGANWSYPPAPSLAESGPSYQSATYDVRYPPGKPLGRVWWRMSMLAIVLLYLFTSYTEILVRLRGDTSTSNASRQPASVVRFLPAVEPISSLLDGRER